VFRGELTVLKAAVILGISERQCLDCAPLTGEKI